MPRKLKRFLAYSALVLLTIHVLRIAFDAGVFRTVEENQHDGACQQLSGPDGPEDITLDRARKLAFISADDRRQAFLSKDLISYESGGIWTLDLSKIDAEPKKLKFKMKSAFHPHGIDLRFDPETGQAIELYVVNHIDMQTHEIDVFTILPSGDLKLRRRIYFPELISPNDIVVLGKDRFFVSNDHGSPRHSLMEMVEDYAGVGLSSVVYFDGEQGHVVIDGLRYANGLALSKDQNSLFVAETTASRLSRYKRGKDELTWHLMDSIKVPIAIDNLEWLDDQHLLTAGNIKIFEFTEHMVNPDHPSPSQAFKINVSDNHMTSESLFLDNGELISGASVATYFESQLLLGAVFEPHLVRCLSDSKLIHHDNS